MRLVFTGNFDVAKTQQDALSGPHIFTVPVEIAGFGWQNCNNSQNERVKAGGAPPAVQRTIKEEKHSMNKKLMALAVAGALGAPAAALAQVEIYGRANLGVDTYSATGAAAGSAADFKSRTRVFDQSSRLGFRGHEDLGGGLKAIYQIESGVNIDTGTTSGQGGQPNTSTGTLATRDSYAGLEGGFGRVQFGRLALWYTNGNVEQMTSNLVNIGTPESSGALSKIKQPLTRQSNVAMYTSPNFSGANVGVYYVPNSEAAVANANTDGNITGLVATYSGIVNVKADWAKNKAQTGARSE